MNLPALDWGRIMAAVVLETLGEPTSRRGSQWRYGTRGSLSVHVSGSHAGSWHSFEDDAGGSVLDFLNYQYGLEREAAWAWLKERRLVDDGASNSPGLNPSSIRSSPKRQTSQKAQRGNHRLREAARNSWSTSERIPTSPDHPARRWMANRHLWRPEFPLPNAVRWIPATNPQFKGLHQGAGSIVVAMASPVDWATAWPAPPNPLAIHLVSIGEAGESALDRPADYGNPGLPKRTMGRATSTVAIIGNPVLEETSSPVRIIEGLADGLALAARFEGPVIASLGTPARLAKDADFVAWLAKAPIGVVIHADADAPGQQAARSFRRVLQDANIICRAVLPPEGTGKDSADVARQFPFATLPDSWTDYATTLTSMNPTWPRWEVARQASIATEGDPNDQ